jgi:aminoglycoside 3-N-acetyltransferase
MEGAEDMKTRRGCLCEIVLVAGELLLRQIYSRWHGLRRWRERRLKNAKLKPQTCDFQQLLEYLQGIGVEKGTLVMVHTGIGGLELTGIAPPSLGGLLTNAKLLLDGLLDLVGPEGTLVMPTHALYQTSSLDNINAPNAVIIYDPRKSPCYVGLVNELFRRRKGVKRSLFPYNMLAASGRLADELLKDNLNERRPSPHGVDSGYFRFCQKNGLIVSIGVPLRRCMTIGHVVEETRPNWPVNSFFEDRRYWVVQNGEAKEWTVRQTRSVFAKYCSCWMKVGRDLVSDGVVHEGNVGTVVVDWARAKEVYDFYYRKTETWPYPYYGLWFMPKSWRRKH